MRLLDLFSGIGGFSLAASWVWGEDLEIVCFCEKDEFCRRVLGKHWPNVPIVEDVNDVERIVERSISKLLQGDYRRRAREIVEDGFPQIDLMCGGPPCQPASTAGLRKGSKDPRWLWPQTLKIVEAVKPRWILFENPLGIVSLAEPICDPQVESKTLRRGKTEDRYEAILTQQEALLLSSIIKDLKDLGYQFPEACGGTPILPVVPASSVGAPHRRDRVFIFARHAANPKSQRLGEAWEHFWRPEEWTTGADCHTQDPPVIRCGSRGTESAGQLRVSGIDGTDCNAADTTESRLQGILKPQNGTRWHTIENPWHEHWYAVAARLCGIFNGLSYWLDRNGGIERYAKTIRPITGQDLPHLWAFIQQEPFQGCVGGFDKIQVKEDVFTILWKLFSKSFRQDNLPFESTEVQEALLRNVWIGNQPGCPSQGWRYNEKYGREYTDSLSSMSHEIALATKKISGNYKSNRVDRLRALGNSIVPQVAAKIMRAIKEADQCVTNAG